MIANAVHISEWSCLSNYSTGLSGSVRERMGRYLTSSFHRLDEQQQAAADADRPV